MGICSSSQGIHPEPAAHPKAIVPAPPFVIPPQLPARAALTQAADEEKNNKNKNNVDTVNNTINNISNHKNINNNNNHHHHNNNNNNNSSNNNNNNNNNSNNDNGMNNDVARLMVRRGTLVNSLDENDNNQTVKNDNEKKNNDNNNNNNNNNNDLVVNILHDDLHNDHENTERNKNNNSKENDKDNKDKNNEENNNDKDKHKNKNNSKDFLLINNEEEERGKNIKIKTKLVSDDDDDSDDDDETELAHRTLRYNRNVARVVGSSSINLHDYAATPRTRSSNFNFNLPHGNGNGNGNNNSNTSSASMSTAVGTHAQHLPPISHAHASHAAHAQYELNTDGTFTIHLPDLIKPPQQHINILGNTNTNSNANNTNNNNNNNNNSSTNSNANDQHSHNGTKTNISNVVNANNLSVNVNVNVNASNVDLSSHNYNMKDSNNPPSSGSAAPSASPFLSPSPPSPSPPPPPVSSPVVSPVTAPLPVDIDHSSLLPHSSHPEYFLRLNWLTHIIQNNGFVTVDFCAQMGRSVHLIDIRSADELLGPIGHIPGVDWIPNDELIDELRMQAQQQQQQHNLASTSSSSLSSSSSSSSSAAASSITKTTTVPPLSSPLIDALIVVVSRDDHSASAACSSLRNILGCRFTAPMRGGIKEWRLMGFSTIRDETLLDRKGQLRKLMKEEQERKEAHAQALALTLSQKGNINLKQKQHISLTEIKEHIGDAANIQWLKMAAFLVHGRQSCVDGRDDSGVIGTPGGDMGEFVMALSILEQLCALRFTFQEVDILLRRRLDAFGRFYMHTDLNALDRLQKVMLSDPRLSSTLSPLLSNPLVYRAWMRSPPLSVRPYLLEHMLNTAHIGCGHIRLMLTHPKQYGIRKKLVLHALRSFFIARWDGSPECEYMALSGEHREGAVINVHLEKKIATFTRIPLISPSCNGKQVFINHSQITSFLRKQMALFFTMQHDTVHLSEGAKDEFYPKLEALASAHLTITLANLAAGLPVFDIQFGEEAGKHVFTCRLLQTHYDDDHENHDNHEHDKINKHRQQEQEHHAE